MANRSFDFGSYAVFPTLGDAQVGILPISHSLWAEFLSINTTSRW